MLIYIGAKCLIICKTSLDQLTLATPVIADTLGTVV